MRYIAERKQQKTRFPGKQPEHLSGESQIHFYLKEGVTVAKRTNKFARVLKLVLISSHCHNATPSRERDGNRILCHDDQTTKRE
ncbi:hypothetical protein VNO77_28048 [Canavalia gladiata]|uniref:Uncharacterized protein n=1 Tax=Canavalia gladiata TaxID=3824 RepID=A0AAN9KVR5_CANGL